MDKLVAILISGAVAGALFSLLGVGLVLTYQTSRIFNFAQGSVSFSVALLYYELTAGFHWPQAPAAVLSILVVAPLLGLVADVLVMRSLAHADEAAKIVATVGLLVALPALALYIVETAVNTFGASIPAGNEILFPGGLGPNPADDWTVTSWFRITSDQLIVILLAVVVASGLWWLTNRTRLGLRMRATVDRPNLAEFRGVDTARTSRTVWMLSFMLAGLVGVAGSPFFALTPAAFTGVLVIGATAAVFGGLRSVPYAFAGGLLIGIVQSLFSGYGTALQNVTGLASALPYVLLLVVLTVRSRRPGRVAGQVADVTLPPDHLADLPRWRRFLPWEAATGVLVLCILVVANGFWLGLIEQGLAYGLILLSFVVVTGIGGMVSLAQTAFVLQASLMTGLLMSHGWPWLAALVVGVGSAVVMGTIVALPALRLDGLALALATLALALIGDSVLFVWKPFSNGTSGWTITRPDLLGINFASDRSLALLLLALVGVVSFLIANLRRSPAGRAMMAVRSAPAASASVGVSSVKTKVAVFAVSSAIAGLGGVMLATVDQSVTSLNINALMGLTWLAIVVMFGVRRPGGAVLAGLVLAFSPQLLSYVTSSTRIPSILFGIGAIYYAKSPDGLLAQVAELGHRRRGARASPGAAAGGTVPAVRGPGVSPGTSGPAARLALPVPVLPALEAPALEVPVLEVRGVCAGYGTVPVLLDIDLEVEAGTVTAVLGPNGSGKSTLCHVIAGGLRPTAGMVLVGGEDVTRVPGHGRAAIGVTFAPESRGIFPGLSVLDNLKLAMPRPEDREAVFEQFPVLKARRRLEAGLLSGGEQQMLALAPIVVHPPKVVVVDEPTLGLAPLVVEEVMALFGRLRDAGTAVVLVEEKARHALDVADRVAFLDRGRISWVGRADDVDAEGVAERYLRAGR